MLYFALYTVTEQPAKRNSIAEISGKMRIYDKVKIVNLENRCLTLNEACLFDIHSCYLLILAFKNVLA